MPEFEAVQLISIKSVVLMYRMEKDMFKSLFVMKKGNVILINLNFFWYLEPLGKHNSVYIIIQFGLLSG